MKTSRLAVCALGAIAWAQLEWTPARVDYAWHFPDDHWRHEGYKTEWWYFTGHLAERGGDRRFAYQFTIFRIGLLPQVPTLNSAWAARDLLMGHAAITDVVTGEHLFSEVLYRATPLLASFGEPGDSLVAWSRGAAGTTGEWHLSWNGSGFDFSMHNEIDGIGMQLSTTAAKPLVFQGPNGFSRKGDGATAASLYYSFTRLGTEGALVWRGDTVAVSGTSWMDKEFGSNQLTDEQVGWDWFSLQLADGRDLMLFTLRNADGDVNYRNGTLIAADGSTTWLDSTSWSAVTRERWTSPTSGATYPQVWDLNVPAAGLDLIVRAVTPDQENVSAIIPDLYYWEGAVRVERADGAPLGRGFVELTGYGDARRPAI